MYVLATVLPMMVCLIWTVIGVLEYSKSDPARRLLMWFGVVASTLYTCHFLHFNCLQSHFSESLYYLCNLAVYPTYALYVRRLTHTRVSFFGHESLWFVPAVVFFFVSLSGVLDPSTVQRIDQWVFPFISLGAIIEAALGLRRFRREVENYYANPKGKRLDPVLDLLVLQTITVVASTISSILGRDVFEGSTTLWIPAVLFSMLLFGIFYAGSHTEFPSADVQAGDTGKEGPAEESVSHGFNEAQQQLLLQKIDAQMRQEELFRTKGLTIADVSEAVGSNRTYVSFCINRLSGMSFSDYVNSFRIRYAQELMLRADAPSLAEIADLAGFADRTSFYRGFKKLVGENPTSWQAKNRV